MIFVLTVNVTSGCMMELIKRSRLPDIPAPSFTESGTESRFCYVNDATPGSHGDEDAGNLPGNPDIQVPKLIEKDDRLHAWRARGGEKNADREEREEEGRTEDSRGNRTSDDSLEVSTQARPERGAEGREFRHVPGGTWLTKVRSFLKDKLY
ncbi:hypothetical protein NDU88_003059 [Pleurodeles waltl]|uniref:Uncharacterized protein n=1 Tax=Pleurodeles waltl TaxID=8319 RepID=A0AAV7NKD4_PLEWA|nr:hypothetical protein NDU88_003059 [Pleurodeles waltl]